MKSQTPYLLELIFKRPIYCEMTHIKQPDDVNHYLRESIDDTGILNHKEFFWVILLTKSHRVLGIRTVSCGSTHTTFVSIKDIAQVALLANATGVVLIHNHPSGNINPSEQDKEITERIQYVLALLNITVLDHIIITQESYFSFVNNNLITHSYPT